MRVPAAFFLLAAIVVPAHAHLMQVCTSSDAANAGKITFYLATYHSCMPGGTVGTMHIKTPSGITSTNAFTDNVCTSGSATIMGSATGLEFKNSVKSTFNLPNDADINCYTRKSDNTIGTGDGGAQLYDSMVLGDSISAGANGDTCFATSSVVTWYRVTVNDAISGTYEVWTTGTDANLDPDTPNSAPCGMSATNHFAMSLSVVAAGNPCPAFTGSVANSAIPNSCKTTVPSGFVCPVVCGLTSTGQLFCDDGSWKNTFACASSTCSSTASSTFTGQGGVTGDGCGFQTAVDVSCIPTCSQQNYWVSQSAQVTCTSAGSWTGSGTCMQPGDDVPSHQPQNVRIITDPGVTNGYKLKWDAPPGGHGGSPVQYYKIAVTSGTANGLPDRWNSPTPPSGGLAFTANFGSSKAASAKLRRAMALSGNGVSISVEACNSNHCNPSSPASLAGPTAPPTDAPTAPPTTQAPTTLSPTATPTDAPTDGPTGQPWTERPVNSPTDNPTSPPTNPSTCTSWSSAATDCNNGCGANGIASGAHQIHVNGANAEVGKCFNCWYELKGLFSGCGGHPYVTQSSLLGSQWCNYCAAKRDCACTSWSGTPPPAPSKSPSTSAIGNVPQNSPVTVQAFGENTGVTCHSTAETSVYKKWTWHNGAVWYKTPNNFLVAKQSEGGVEVDSHGVLCSLPSDIAATGADSPDAVEITCQGDENDANDVCDIFLFQFFKADCPGGDGKALKDTGNWCERFQEAAPVIELSDGKHYAMKALRRQVAAGTTVKFAVSRKYTLVGAHKGIKDPVAGSAWCNVPTTTDESGETIYAGKGSSMNAQKYASGCLEGSTADTPPPSLPALPTDSPTDAPTNSPSTPPTTQAPSNSPTDCGWVGFGAATGMSGENDWDGHYGYECPAGHVMNRLYSHHSNHKEDRKWSMNCKPVNAPSSTGNCYWTGWSVLDANDYVVCNNNGAIVGMQSNHDNGKEDRSYAWKCCEITNTKETGKSALSGFLNHFDAALDVTPQAGHWWSEIFSQHSNGNEDRAFKGKWSWAKHTNCN